MTAVSLYSSFDKIECQFSIGILKGKVLALTCSKTQIQKIHLKPLAWKGCNSKLRTFKLETISEQNKAFFPAKRILF